MAGVNPHHDRGQLGLSPFSVSQSKGALHYTTTRDTTRVVGGGPVFRKFGRRVMYAFEDLQHWAGLRRCDSTSDPAHKVWPE
ncbi:MAG: transcriptional regulator [Sphingomonas bacterium]|uniref:hypothetical protein n=1 Tax=Sphingomonas bacterium TaxID=1895847 RepID=UPI002A5631A2|nr:transcriptional regulator [Sphingomonas bacterium]